MDEPTSVSELWAEAIKAYEEGLEEDSKMRSRQVDIRRLSSTQAIAEYIESTSGSFADFRKRQPKVWSSLQDFIAPLQSFLQFAQDPISSTGFGVPISALMGAVVKVLEACDEVSSSYDQIESMFLHLQAFSSRLGMYLEDRSGTGIEAPLKRQIIKMLHILLKILGRSEHLIRRGRRGHGFRSMIWGKDKTTNDLLESLEQAFSLELGMVDAINYARNKRIEETTEKIRQNIEKTKLEEKADLVRIHLTGDSSAHKNVAKILEKNREDMVQDTGMWLRDEPMYQEWESGRVSLLWLVGDAGLGKSFLATSLIQNFQSWSGEDQRTKTPMAYFFIKEGDKELRDANTILKTLAWQLQGQDSEFRQHLDFVITRPEKVANAEETWTNIFLSYYSESGSGRRAIVVLDGLDEANDTRASLLRILAGHSERRPSENLRFIILGRKEMTHTESHEHLILDLSRLRARIEVGKNKNSGDIERYVRKRVNDMWVFHQLRKVKGDQEAMLKGSNWGKRIIRVAKGVFLFAKLLLDQIELADSLKDIKEALNNPPVGLDQMIDRLFTRLESDPLVRRNRDTVRLILAHATYSRRTVLVGEVDVLLNATNGETGLTLWFYLTKKLHSIFDFSLLEELGEDDMEDLAQEGEAPMVDGVNGASSTPDVIELDLNIDLDSEYHDSSEDDDDDFIISGRVVAEKAQLRKLTKRSSTMSTWKFDTVLTEAQIKTPLYFSHQLILEGIKQEGLKKHKSLIPDADTSEVIMVVNCLKILRAMLPTHEEWRFLAEYPLRYLADHLKEASRCTSVTNAQRHDILEHLYWLFGTERGVQGLVNAMTGFDAVQVKVLETTNGEHGFWSREAFWDTWVASDENWKVVQGWLATYGQVTWANHIDEKAKSWMATASQSYSDLLRLPLQYVVLRWLGRVSYGHPYFIHDRDWEACLAMRWAYMVEFGESLEPGCALRKEPFGPRGPEHVATYSGRPLDSMAHHYIGTLMKFMAESFQMNQDMFTRLNREHQLKALKLDPENWRAFEYLAYNYAESSQRNIHKAVVYQALAHELCSNYPYMSFLVAEDGILSLHLDKYLMEARQSDESMELVLGAIWDLDNPKHQARSMAYLTHRYPQLRFLIETSSAELNQERAQVLADAIEVLLARQKCGQDPFSQAQGLRNVASPTGTYSEEKEQAAFVHVLQKISAQLKSSPRTAEYDGWVSMFCARLYADRYLSSTASDEKDVWLNKLKSLSQSSISNYQGDTDSSAYFAALLPSLYLHHIQGEDPGASPHIRGLVTPWLVSQIESLEEPWREPQRRARQSSALALVRVLSIVDTEAATIFYAALLGYAALCCGHIDEAEIAPEAGSVRFDMYGLMPFCDGKKDSCSPDVTSCNELWRCDLCADRDWCDSCLITTRQQGDGKLCLASHTSRQIWPVPREAFEEAVTCYRGAIWIRRGWWEQFRVKWKA